MNGFIIPRWGGVTIINTEKPSDKDLNNLGLDKGVMHLVEEKRQKEIPNWYNGKGPGMNTEKAYKMLKNRENIDTVP